MSDAHNASTGAPCPDHAIAPAPRLRRWLALVLIWPLLLLLPCLSGARVFLPYDLAQYPPASLLATDEEVSAMRAESNYDVTETPIWFVPELQRARHTLLAEGTLPNWNPTARTGTALLPHGHDAIWYPFTWPCLLFSDPSRWLAWLALCNLATAGIGMLGFLLALRLHPAAAAFGAIALAMSTTLSANAHNYPRLSSLVWLPSMLWALRVAADGQGRRRARALCGFAAAFALTWLGGFPPYALPCSAVAMVYGLALAAEDAKTKGLHNGLRRALPLAGAALLGVLLCAHYLLPAFAFFGESARSLAPNLDRISQTKFDRYGLLGWLLPDLFGRPDLSTTLPYGNAPLPLLLGNRTSANGTVLLPNFNATEYALFSGTIVAWLALLGLMARDAAHRWLPLLLLASCLGMALFVPGFAQLFLLPGLRVVPPLRWLGPCAFLLAWLAAQGLQTALRGDARLRLPLAALLALGTAAVALWFSFQFDDGDVFRHWRIAEQLAAHFGSTAPDPASITPERIEQLVLRGPGGDYAANGAALAAVATQRAAALHFLAGLALLWLWRTRSHDRRARWLPFALAAVITLTGVDLWLADRTFDRGIARPHHERTEVHDFLVAERAATATTGGFMIARAAPTTLATELPEPSQLPPGTLGPEGIRDLQAYTYFDSRSIQPWTALLSKSLGDDAGLGITGKGYLTACLPDAPLVLASPLLDLFGIRYVLSTSPLQHGGQRTGPQLRSARGEFFLYQRATALPRAFVVGSLQQFDRDADVIAAMVEEGFTPRLTALAQRADTSTIDAATLDAAASQRSVRFVRDHAVDIEIAIGDGPAGLLVLCDTFFPGWTASVDGTDVPVARVDHSMRGVMVPAGAHTVRFRYTAARQQLGLALFGIGLAVLVITLRRSRSSRLA